MEKEIGNKKGDRNRAGWRADMRHHELDNYRRDFVGKIAKSSSVIPGAWPMASKCQRAVFLKPRRAFCLLRAAQHLHRGFVRGDHLNRKHRFDFVGGPYSIDGREHRVAFAASARYLTGTVHGSVL
jgi:hypothetical protein